MPAVVREQTEGWGADVVIEATGVPAVWENCDRLCVRVQQSTCSEVVQRYLCTVNTEQLHYSELTLKGVFHNTPGM